MSLLNIMLLLQQTARLQARRQSQVLTASSSQAQATLRRLFAEDALDSSEKLVIKGREGATKAAETWDDTKGAVKETVDKSEQKSKSVADSVKDQAKKEMNTASDMVKDIPQKTAETAQGLKEVGVEAAKAAKRDAERLAEKVGIKEKKPGDLDRTEF